MTLEASAAYGPLGSIADMCTALGDVRFVPIADIRQRNEEAAWGQAASKRTSQLGTGGTCPAKNSYATSVRTEPKRVVPRPDAPE